MNKRKLLKDCLEEDFVPLLLKKGFRRAAAPKDGKRTSPLGYFRRGTGKRLQSVDIQFDKVGKAKFVLNLYLGQGWKGRQSCRLYQWQAGDFMKWFSLPALAFPGDAKAGAERTVRRLVELFSEAEHWFATLEPGSHIRYYENIGNGKMQRVSPGTSGTSEAFRGFMAAFSAHVAFISFLYLADKIYPDNFGPCGPANWLGILMVYTFMAWGIIQFFYLLPLYFFLRMAGWLKSSKGILLGALLPIVFQICVHFCFGK
jgi:hypothetical protein